MAREQQNVALALVEELEAPSSGRFTLLPPAPPCDDFDLIGPSSDVLSLAALEAALDTLPFDDDTSDVLLRLDLVAVKADAANDGVPECDRPTKRYTIPDVPPCMRATTRPDV